MPTVRSDRYKLDVKEETIKKKYEGKIFLNKITYSKTLWNKKKYFNYV